MSAEIKSMSHIIDIQEDLHPHETVGVDLQHKYISLPRPMSNAADRTDSDMLDALPVVLQQQIAADVSKYGLAHIYALRRCSQQLRNSCNETIRSASVPANMLADALCFVKRLPFLEGLVIQSKTLPETRICGDAFSSLRVQLKAVSFTNGDFFQENCIEDNVDSSELKESRVCTMVLQNLGMTLQPWHESLETLLIDHCKIAASWDGNPYGLSIFSQFPRLHTLHLVSSKACRTFDAEQVSMSLDLSGCKALQFVNCSGSSVSAVDLDGCQALKSLKCRQNTLMSLSLTGCSDLMTLDCQCNHLTSLGFLDCTQLKHLQCSFNHIQEIILHPTIILDTLLCAGNQQRALIMGGDMLSAMECTANTFGMLSLAMRRQLVRLSLVDDTTTGVLTGFRDLNFLRCRFREAGSGYVNLNGCTNVELDCHCTSDYFPIHGFDAVSKLTLIKLDILPPNLNAFKKLEELHLTTRCRGILNFSACEALRKVFLINEPSGLCYVTAIDLAGCLYLDELCCDYCHVMTELNLSGCEGLKALTCVQNCLKVLDLSDCPLLTRLDVSASPRLRRVTTSYHVNVLDLTSTGCSNLRVSITKEAWLKARHAERHAICCRFWGIQDPENNHLIVWWGCSLVYAYFALDIVLQLQKVPSPWLGLIEFAVMACLVLGPFFEDLRDVYDDPNLELIRLCVPPHPVQGDLV